MNLAFALMDDMKFYQAGQVFFGTGAVLMIAALSASLLWALQLLTLATAPGLSGRCSTAIREHPVFSLLGGAAVFVCMLLLLALAGKTGRPAVVSGLLFPVSLVTVLGLTSSVENVGRRLYWVSGKEGSRAAHLSAGWLVAFGASCVPILGWFIVLPYLVLSGLGSLPVALLLARPATSPRPGADVEIS